MPKSLFRRSVKSGFCGVRGAQARWRLFPAPAHQQRASQRAPERLVGCKGAGHARPAGSRPCRARPVLRSRRDRSRDAAAAAGSRPAIVRSAFASIDLRLAVAPAPAPAPRGPATASSAAFARASRATSRAMLRASMPSCASCGISSRQRGARERRSRLVGSSANGIFACRAWRSAAPSATSSSGRTR